MFFNCCKRFCCCNQNDSKQTNCYDKYEYNRCDRHDNHNERDCRDDKHDKCEYDKKEKCCCHINFEKKYGCDKNNDNRFDRYDDNYSNNQCDRKYFNGQSYYCEYNNLGYFNNQENLGYDNISNRKPCQKDEQSYGQDSGKNCYTPNWECDRDCKCEKDKNDKYDKNDNKCCKPVKYICIPFDKY